MTLSQFPQGRQQDSWLTYRCVAAIKEGIAVKLSTTVGFVEAVSGANDVPVGVAVEDSSANSVVTVATDGAVKIVLGAAVASLTAPTAMKVNASGKFIAATTNDAYYCLLLQIGANDALVNALWQRGTA